MKKNKLKKDLIKEIEELRDHIEIQKEIRREAQKNTCNLVDKVIYLEERIMFIKKEKRLLRLKLKGWIAAVICLAITTLIFALI